MALQFRGPHEYSPEIAVEAVGKSQNLSNIAIPYSSKTISSGKMARLRTNQYTEQ
jgi:hypothetical protein